ncbi:protein of unknown function (plasmid) [Cupriavidus taiwanensis]|uniref:Uncharacterized protein n=1 Tax=Cupriavidus taiwanensis TaxID=164546 RepID=A0A375ILV9_9BURK|nr:hypothetical protein CBM2588_B170074 [Cupriavidus taiwanensis]SPK74462.1 protein of unknown function [Cupriavidus taiwanensis]
MPGGNTPRVAGRDNGMAMSSRDYQTARGRETVAGLPFQCWSGGHGDSAVRNRALFPAARLQLGHERLMRHPMIALLGYVTFLPTYFHLMLHCDNPSATIRENPIRVIPKGRTP